MSGLQQGFRSSLGCFFGVLLTQSLAVSKCFLPNMQYNKSTRPVGAE